MDNDVMAKLNEISVSIAEIKKELQFKNDHCKYEEERINKIEKMLYGNGTPGIRTQVYILWSLFILAGGILLK